jgi:pimeloyl-ACP methyl ester carboxylesterase
MTAHFVTTPVLRIAYERGGPADGASVILLHGWPDDVRTFDEVVPALQAAGFQTVVPWLRGFGPTSFLSADTMRSGEMVAMAQDAIDLADALKLQTFAVIGHDWGARIAYILAAVFRPTFAHCRWVGSPANSRPLLWSRRENIGTSGSWPRTVEPKL